MKATIINAARRGLEWMQARLAAEAGLRPKIVAYWDYWERIPGERPIKCNSAPAKMQKAFAMGVVAFEGNEVQLHMAAGR